MGNKPLICLAVFSCLFIIMIKACINLAIILPGLVTLVNSYSLSSKVKAARANTGVKCIPGNYVELQSGECTKCPDGYYQPYSEQHRCYRCPIGHYSEEGSPKCKKCKAGTYQNYTGQKQCKPCIPGFYQSDIGMSYCNMCPNGYYQPWGGQHTCLSCKYFQWEKSSTVPITCEKSKRPAGGFP